MSYNYDKKEYTSGKKSSVPLTSSTMQTKRESSSMQQMLQLQKAAGNDAVRQMYQGPSRQLKEDSSNNSKDQLPSNVQAKMENSFNADFSDVRVHENSASASKVGALAYAQGNDLHFAPGQYQPSSAQGQQLIGHEMAHVVQQRQGKVKPTVEIAGVPVNDDPSLEREADSLGKLAADTTIPSTEP